jgi:hypothetical protein
MDLNFSERNYTKTVYKLAVEAFKKTSKRKKSFCTKKLHQHYGYKASQNCASRVINNEFQKSSLMLRNISELFHSLSPLNICSFVNAI